MQYLRELLKEEVLYNTPNDHQVSKSLDKVWAVWQKFIRTLVASYANRLLRMSWIDTESMDRLVKQLQEYEEHLTSLRWPCSLTTEKRIQIFSEQFKERRSSVTPAKVSTIESAFLCSRERLLMTYPDSSCVAERWREEVGWST